MNGEFEARGLFGTIVKLSRTVRRYTSNNKDHVGRIDMLRVFLLRSGDISLNELAGRMDVRPPSVSEWIEKLSESGDITKTRDEADKRIIRYRLTDKGRASAEEARAKMDRTADIFDGCLSPQEEQEFVRLCRVLQAHLRSKIDERAGPSAESPERHGGHRRECHREHGQYRKYEGEEDR